MYRSQIVWPNYFSMVGNLLATRFSVFAFRFLSPVRRRVAAANRGRLFFGYLLLAKQKKVTCCRTTPGGFDLFYAEHQLKSHPAPHSTSC
jgi:hypothetical protein